MSAGAPTPLSAPDITEREIAAVVEVLRSPTLSLGPKLEEFEAALAQRAGTRHAVAVNSGTSALHLAVKAAGIGEGDEVITTPFSFVATSNAVLFERGVPVFVDIERSSYNLDPERIEAAVTPRTRAILAVDVFGRPAAMERIGELAGRYGLKVIEDACEALGARRNGRPAGSFGQSGTFAFYPNKQITTGEGGALVTSEARVAELARSWRNQGRCGSGGSAAAAGNWLAHERLGYNYRLSDIQCALGTVQLERLDEILACRAQVAAWYSERLAQFAGWLTPPAATPAPGEEVSWFVYVVRLDERRFGRAERDAVIEGLRARGIGANNYFTPIHLQPFYRERFGFRPGDFPVTESVAARTVALPFFTRMSREQVEAVCRTLGEVVGEVARRRRAA